MMKIIKYSIISTIFLIFSCSVSEKQETKKEIKKIIVLIGTNDIEIKSDLDRSIEGISDFLIINDIKIINRSDTLASGYILILNGKKKIIESAMTDVDLYELCKEFFKEENLN